MKSPNRYSRSLQAGFTLVEIMVGLVIGMLAAIVILQVFSVFEAQKRTTTGTADAQTNGGIALYNINRELQLAGYPLMPVTDSALECTTLTFNGTASTTDLLTPVTIIDGVSDTIILRYGNSLAGGAPATITAVGAPTPLDITLTSNLGCQANDITLIVDGTACVMSSATAVTGATTVTLNDVTGAAAGLNLACLGMWSGITYAVNNGNLDRSGTPSVAGVVNLQAQYGISAAGLPSNDPNFNQIISWVDASGVWAAPTVVNRNRIKAIRIAVIARNAKMEPGVVTPNALTAWAGGPVIDLSADADWQRYRYRVFETIVPLRNVIWAKGTL